MSNEMNSYSLFSSVEKSNIEWLWYPYIPCGKITILQGDPGGGKSTMIMDLIGRLTTGRKLLDGRTLKPINVLYQNSEDGLADTIKPRLEQAKANCQRVGYITEDILGFSLDDERIRTAIVEMNARLLVIDPFQAYIGDTDLSNARGIRRILRRLSMWASAYNCAVVLVGHLNKKSSANELYRGLGSIDFIATARSVIQVDSNEDDEKLRTIKHIKSSLAPKGKEIEFEIDENGNINWNSTEDEVKRTQSLGFVTDDSHKTKQEIAVEMMKRILADGPVEATVVVKELSAVGMSDRTIKIAKKAIAVISRKSNGKWYWCLQTADGKYPEIMEKTENE